MERVSLQGLVEQVAQAEELPKAQVARTLRRTLKLIIEHLAMERRVTLTGFGTFSPRIVAPRAVRNPRTGAIIEIDARGRVSFSAGKLMREIAEAAITRALEQGHGGEVNLDSYLILMDGDEDDGEAGGGGLPLPAQQAQASDPA